MSSLSLTVTAVKVPVSKALNPEPLLRFTSVVNCVCTAEMSWDGSWGSVCCPSPPSDRSKDSRLFVFLLKSGQKPSVLTDLYVSVDPVCPSASSPNIKISFAPSLRLGSVFPSSYWLLVSSCCLWFSPGGSDGMKFPAEEVLFVMDGTLQAETDGRDLRLNRICPRCSRGNPLRSETRNTRPTAPQSFSSFTVDSRHDSASSSCFQLVWQLPDGAAGYIYTSCQSDHISSSSLYM